MIEEILSRSDEHYAKAMSMFECFKGNDLYKNLSARRKSISLILNHDFIQTPSVEIKLDVLDINSFPVGSYCLILDLNNEFIDEFLSLNS